MPQTVPFHESLLDTHLPVDVRTPLEFEEDHIPGALNVPLLTNEERVEIGTLYKQVGPLEARRRGLELTAHRFPAMVAEIVAHAAGRPILVYCWRGGLRSKTVTSILDLTGHDAVQLVGGYKAFRTVVTEYFEPFRPPAPLVVLHGMTGIGKTTLLLKLAAAGHSTVDLEGLANHRGSAFGELGLSQSLTQKRFETLLWDAFRRLPADRPVIVEGESRRIGRMTLPGNLYEVMRESVKIWCVASVETRVARLMEEYGLPEYREGMAEALLRIRKKLGGDRYEELAGHLERWEMAPFMEGLIRGYYDKLYYKTREWTEDATIALEDFDAAQRELEQFLATRDWGTAVR
ncbi:tRNA 2-selenouridine(34) synthase MnmH [Geobacter pickeringii]|uniref:tRNA 2-selenouridine synthase n=1 Tax=Geobacter pickeringii TaxID=345632 RepID=A0A0B5BF28_9BACT|nr:tRNA 2-selenouridine(34) synthase MnmH [Geobacter pickeringii]AJE03749.1 tRNA 2-selenouridine synthase [Geobacter pickeringii]